VPRYATDRYRRPALSLAFFRSADCEAAGGERPGVTPRTTFAQFGRPPDSPSSLAMCILCLKVTGGDATMRGVGFSFVCESSPMRGVGLSFVCESSRMRGGGGK